MFSQSSFADRSALAVLLVLVLDGAALGASYENFEVSHVHPIALTPSGGRLLAVNTPDAMLEVFTVAIDGSLVPESSIPVGLEPVSVVARTDSEAWVANHLSDTVSIVDLTVGTTVRTLAVGDEPTDVAFAGGRAFVAVSQEDAVKAFDLANLALPPQVVDLFSRDVRALAVSNNGTKVYAVTLRSGNRTTVINANVASFNDSFLIPSRLTELGLNDLECDGAPPPHPPLPPGITRNPTLNDPPDGVPRVAVIVRWNETAGQWQDDAGQDWSHCAPFRLPDHDLFVIDAATLAVSEVDHLGTSLFEVSVNPANGKIYVPNTDARNHVRFEHPLGVQGHVVNNYISVVDPGAGNAVTLIDLNTHINRSSDPATNLPERLASISQPGMMAWKSDGSEGWLTAIGSRKVFRLDGSCLSGSCIFGTSRAAPEVLEVGEGPTGVAYQEAKDRLYVLNRFSNSIAVAEASTLTLIDEIPLHDPSSATILDGRRFLYDAIDTSGHGDAACSSCHLSGDLDGLAWDLGNPEGSQAVYGVPGDNVRFIEPSQTGPQECPTIGACADHQGFDPQKGPMTTQTLRAMIEPLHWRGDRGTMTDFNPAFVGLLGAEDVGPVNGKEAGLTAAQMEQFRQFALKIKFPPNPYRMVDDNLPDATIQVPGHPVAGNPTTGKSHFENLITENLNVGCQGCHAAVFGTAGGKIGGIDPGDPNSDRAALFGGTQVLSPHSDLKVPHIRNMYEKTGPVFGPAGGPYPDGKAGFGFIHDGSVPDLATFLALNTFVLSADQIRDMSTFLLHFPSGVKPAVGRNVTVPAGTPPTGTPAEENLITALQLLGDRVVVDRDCELVASTFSGGRTRRYYLEQNAWVGDVAGEMPITTQTLRETATNPITFLCGTIDSGVRLGSDRDEDGALNGDDCAPADASATDPVIEVMNLAATGDFPTGLQWINQIPVAGPGVVYDVVSGSLLALQSSGLPATGCLAGDVPNPAYSDASANPPPGDGRYYLVRAENGCGAGGFGAGRSSLDALACD